MFASDVCAKTPKVSIWSMMVDSKNYWLTVAVVVVSFKSPSVIASSGQLFSCSLVD